MKRTLQIGWIVAAAALAVTLLGSGQEAKKGDAPKADAKPAAAAAEKPAALVSGTYQVDPIHSSNVFRIKHMNVANFYGRFDEMEGSFTLDSADASKCAFEVKIKTGSVNTNSDGRDKHLKSAEFFDAEQFPELTFKSKSCKKLDDGRLSVAGDLTMRGETKPLTVTIEPTGTGKMRAEERFGIETTFVIKRSEFGMTTAPGMFGEDVRITVSIEGVKQ